MNLDGNTTSEDEEDIAYMRYKSLYKEKEFIPDDKFMINLEQPKRSPNSVNQFVNGFMIPLN
jgi:hypothetical protein